MSRSSSVEQEANGLVCKCRVNAPILENVSIMRDTYFARIIDEILIIFENNSSVTIQKGK